MFSICLELMSSSYFCFGMFSYEFLEDFYEILRKFVKLSSRFVENSTLTLKDSLLFHSLTFLVFRSLLVTPEVMRGATRWIFFLQASRSLLNPPKPLNP